MCEQQTIQDAEGPLRASLGTAHLLHLQDRCNQRKNKSDELFLSNISKFKLKIMIYFKESSLEKQIVVQQHSTKEVSTVSTQQGCPGITFIMWPDPFCVEVVVRVVRFIN